MGLFKRHSICGLYCCIFLILWIVIPNLLPNPDSYINVYLTPVFMTMGVLLCPVIGLDIYIGRRKKKEVISPIAQQPVHPLQMPQQPAVSPSSFCPRCGTSLTGSFCESCGYGTSSLAETEIPRVQKIEKVTSEIEITDNFKRYYTVAIVPIMCFLIVFMSLLAILLVISAINAPTASGSGIMIGILLIVCMPLILLAIFALYYGYTYFVPERRFYISNQKIEIFVPKKPLFEIYWSQFDQIKIKRKWVYRG